jgi:hypothetical protein
MQQQQQEITCECGNVQNFYQHIIGQKFRPEGLAIIHEYRYFGGGQKLANLKNSRDAILAELNKFNKYNINYTVVDISASTNFIQFKAKLYKPRRCSRSG